ncbi:hypothetical protein [Algoriphagus sp. Y33]|uniref:hypothetical protein n=1 Tax=Algoriphagus sp. Y33 TaxID=2772483 RepID=UPI0017872DC0|nr:hypothetical protein [Algoriphagus sp. Y33]
MALFSCDKEDEDPSLLLEGSYENVLPTSEETPTYITVMTFSTTGNLLIERFITPVGSNERCLSSYSEGTYLLRGEDFTETITATFGFDPEEFDIFQECPPKDQMVKNSDPESSGQSSRLVLDDSNESFTLYYPCNDVEGLSGNCIGDLSYTKIE